MKKKTSTEQGGFKCKIFLDQGGFWRWHAVNDNNKVVEVGQRAFTQRHNCMEDARRAGYSL